MRKEADSSELRDKETARGDHRPVRGDAALLCVLWRDSAAERAGSRLRGRLDADVVLAWLEERRGKQFHRRGPVPRQPSESDLEKLRAMARGL